MNDNKKTKHELIEELKASHSRIAELEDSENELYKEVANLKWIEDAIKEIKNKFKNLISTIPGVVFQREFDADWTMLFMSDEIENLSGYSASDFVKNYEMSFPGIIHPDDLPVVEEAIQHKIDNCEPYTMEYRIIDKDGRVRWVSDKGKGVYNKIGNIAWIDGVIFDITDQKLTALQIEQQNQELQATHKKLQATMEKLETTNLELTNAHTEAVESTERYKKFSEVATEGIVFHDRGKIVDTNSACDKMFGYKKSEMIGMSILDTAHKDYKHTLHQYVAHNTEQYEGMAIRKDGTAFPAEVYAKEVQYKGKTYRVATVKDLTYIKKAEEALRRSEQKLNSIVKNTPDVIYRLDKEGNITFINDAVKKYGYHPKDLLGESFLYIVHPEDRELAKYKIDEKRSGTRKTKNLEIRLITKKQSSLIHESSERGIINEKVFLIEAEGLYDSEKASASTFIGIQGVARDITERKQAEDAIRKNEEQYRLLADNVTDVIWTTDLDFQIKYVSPSVEKLRGYTIDEVLIQPLDKTLSPESLKYAYELLNYEFENIQNRTYKPKVIELELLRKDGSTVLTESTISILYNEDKTPNRILGVTRDITERKEMEKIFRENEKKYRMLFESAPVGIGMTHTDGEIINFNTKLTKITGYQKSELMNKNLKDMYYNIEDRWLLQKSLEEKGYLRDYEIKLRKKDGTIYDALFYLTPVVLEGENAILVVVSDITEFKRVEMELTESEERFRYLADASIEGIIINKDGICLEANQVAADIFGFKDPSEMIGIHAIDTIAPESHGIVKEHLFKHSEEPYEAIAQRKDGSTFPAEIRAKLMPYKGDTVRVTSIRDISEQKKVEAEKGKIESHLRQSQKMEAIGTLAGGIAHDFNNILSGIFGYTELALKKISQEDRVKSYLEQVLQASNRASDLVKQILTLSRQQDQEQKAISISPLVKEIVKLLRASLPTTVEIQKNISVQSDVILADATQIHQILMNLCTNAAHAMQQNGGILSIDLDNVTIDSRSVDINPDLTEGQYLKLSVTDTGHGISREIIDRIFDPFFTTKEKGKGTGLGLSVIHGIIKSYYGSITVESTEGKGTTFEVYLPLDMSLLKHDEIEDKIPLPGGNECVLLVDDEALLVKLEQELLEDLGYKVVSRTSSIEALEAFKSQPGKFDIVITDQTMPNLTGAYMAKEMIKIRPDIPIILCTGFSEQISPEKTRALGIKEFLYKPVISRNLAEAIRRALEKNDTSKQDEIISGDLSKMLPLFGKKILVAEDIPANRKLMALMLKKIGCESETVTNGIEALEKIRDMSFDAILMDINMPVMGGVEATKIIRKEINGEVPIIALTGSDFEHERDNFLNAGINDFIPKPINSDKLNEILQKWMR